MIDPRTLDDATRTLLQRQVNSRLDGLRQDRMSFWAHWSQLAEMYLPRRYKWFVTANQWNRGSQMNAQIVDETGVLAARTCAAGMMSGLTSPTRDWFRLGLADYKQVPYGDVKNWLADVQRRMMRVFAQSNFYTSLGNLYHDLTVFSSAAMLIYEDAEDVICCQNPDLGEFFLANNKHNYVDTFYREFTLTISQVVDQFGLDACSPSTTQAYYSGGSARTREIVICHAVEPNTQLWEDATRPLAYVVPKSFRYREVYWEQAATGGQLLAIAGYREKNFVGARWSINSNDAYGTGGPGMDALPAVRQLQIEQRRKAEAIDKMVRPPMTASISMKNEPASTLPGSITYVADLSGAGFKPAYLVDPRLAELTADLKEVQDRVGSMFYVDLFMMISNLDTVRTATEIDARKEEKLVQLGPVIERFENEVLDEIIERTFAIMQRRGLIPPPPPGLSGAEINVQYISMLAEAQGAASTAAIERVLGLAGNVAAVDPTVLDNINIDNTIAIYADSLGIDPNCIRSTKEILSIRAQRAQQQQQQAALQQTLPAVQGAQALSQTNVGGGQNALAAMING